jgi:tetratricopeptide (TPR) repeat protein
VTSPGEMPVDSIAASNQAVQLMQAYSGTGRVDRLQAAVGMFRSAVAASPPDDPNRGAFLTNLGNAVRELATKTDSIPLLQEAVLLCREAVATIPAESEQRAFLLPNLGLALHSLFTRTSEADLLSEALQVATEMVAVIRTASPEQVRFLLALASALRETFFKTGDITWLSRAAQASRAAVSSASDDLSGATALAFMIGVLILLAEHADDSSALQEAILAGQDALSVMPVEHPTRPMLLSHYGGALRVMSGRTDDPALLEAAVIAGRQAVSLAKWDDPDLPGYHSNLAGSLLVLFQRAGNLPLLREALANSREAATIAPTGHQKIADILSTLSVILHELFKQTEEISYLEDAVTLSRDALSSLLPASDSRTGLLRVLEANLLKLAEQTGGASLLTEAVAAMREAVELTPPEQADHADYLWELMVDCRLLSAHTGERSPLREAVMVGRGLLSNPPADHDARAILSFLRDSLSALAQLTNELSDMTEAADAARQVIQEAPSRDDPAADVTALFVALRGLYERTGDQGYLTEAVAAARQAVALAPADDSRQGAVLSNLGIALHSQYERTGEIALLEEAVKLGREGTAVTPVNDPDRPVRLSNLGISLRLMFERTGSLAVLREAATISRAALAAVGTDDLRRPDLLANLTHILLRLSSEIDDADIVNEAVATAGEALAAAPINHPRRPRYLSTLAGTYANHFHQTGDPADLMKAVSAGRAAIDAAPVGSIGRAGYLLNNGRYHEMLHAVDGGSDSIAEAARCFEEVAGDESAPLAMRITAYRKLAGLASREGGDPQQALRAAEEAVALLPKISSGLLSRTDREDAIGKVAGLASQAAAAALSTGSAERAIELLEQARGNLAATTLDMRSRNRAAVPQPTDQPQAGPIVYVNASEIRCDALIVTPGAQASVRTVPLPRLTRDGAFHQVNRITAARGIAVSREATHDLRVKAQGDIHAILRWMWDAIAEPILAALGLDSPAQPGVEPRLWWCPVGILSYLPLHAAGYHATAGSEAKPGRTVIDRAVSSYTTTARALSVTRQQRVEAAQDTRTGPEPTATAIISEPGGGDIPYLPGVDSETRMLAELIPDSRAFRSPTREEVIGALPAYDVVHFACHALSMGGRLNAGCLILRDYRSNPLTMEHITALNLNHARLAYLSACETALAHPRLADEAVHLSGAFQLAGYWNVIGTFWPIDDAISTTIAHSFYDHLTHQGKTPPDTDVAARALHNAVRLARDRYVNLPTLWASYFHTGV